MLENDSIWQFILNFLTFFGGWSTIRTIIFFILRHHEKDHYIESDLKFKFVSDLDQVSLEELVPISYPIILQENSRTIILIRFPGQTMKDIKIFEYSEDQKSLNKSIVSFLDKAQKTNLLSKNIKLYNFIDRIKLKTWNFDKSYKLCKHHKLSIQSEEYLAIQGELAEGIPQYRIDCRVNGKKLNFIYKIMASMAQEIRNLSKLVMIYIALFMIILIQLHSSIILLLFS